MRIAAPVRSLSIFRMKSTSNLQQQTLENITVFKKRPEDSMKHLPLKVTAMVNTTNGEASEDRSAKRSKVSLFSVPATKMEELKDQNMRYNSKLWETTLSGFNASRLTNTYKGARLPIGWKAFSSVIFLEADGLQPSEKIAAFDFDGCLANTNVRRAGAHAWSLQFPSIPDKLQSYYDDGYKLVIFSNESNIERWSKKRQAAVDSKLGRVEAFLKVVKVPMQAFVSCGKEGTGDACRKPSPGMWHLLERHLNCGVQIDRERSFYVGDAAGRQTDHSAADLDFAKAVGLKFFVPEEVFVLPSPLLTVEAAVGTP